MVKTIFKKIQRWKVAASPGSSVLGQDTADLQMCVYIQTNLGHVTGHTRGQRRIDAPGPLKD